MILLKNKPNTLAPYTGYQYGDSKDNTGSNNGTPLNRAVLNDYHMFFERIFGLSGLASNNLPDNDTNGYQLVEALKLITRRNLGVAQVSADAVMATYVASFGYDSISQIGFQFFGQSAAISFDLDDSANLSDGTRVVLINDGDYKVTISATGSDNIGSGAATSIILSKGQKIDLILDIANGPRWLFKFGEESFIVVGSGGGAPAFGTGYTAPIQAARFKRTADGRVVIEGAVSKSGSYTGAIFTLPLGYRPAVAKKFPIFISNGSTFLMDSVTINTNGNVSWDQLQYTFSTAVDIYFGDMSFYID